MDRIVITTQEVDRTEVPVQAPQEIRPRLPRAVPVWAILLISPLVVALPLLCLVALVLRLTVGRKTPRVQQAWTSYLLTLLIVSGFLSTVLGILTISLSWAPAPDALSAALSNLDERGSFPELPSGKIMSGVELSSTLKPLVLLASPTEKRWFQSSVGTSGLLGAAMILESDAHGYLLATARHVADGESWQGKTGPQKVMVSDGMNGWAVAQVVGRHKRYDVALLWLERHDGDAKFHQPIATYKSVQPGEKVFVIGHPEGLNFSVSNGIVSRTPGNDVLQISAPISPGNSGGPVYDEYGNLLGVVTSKVARSMEPEAENLNFAVSTDALLHQSDWELVQDKKAPAGFLTDFLRDTKVRKAATDKAAP
ncbi:MAG TPA: serine protease [Verrucomicrobiae bacterium]|jgi:S1-C subfamily serine protease|nr:serine protease [Verrucomicrobiae bacterium]